MIRFCVLVFACTGLISCASTVAKILPPGFAPVTKERCEALDMKAMGEQDGRVGNRPGEKLDFWKRDCGPFGVEFNRPLYDEGYNNGLKTYCSCEEGFMVGVRGQFEELKGQFLACPKAMYKTFIAGRDLGTKEFPNHTEMNRDIELKKYSEEDLKSRAVKGCQALNPDSPQ